MRSEPIYLPPIKWTNTTIVVISRRRAKGSCTWHSYIAYRWSRRLRKPSHLLCNNNDVTSLNIILWPHQRTLYARSHAIEMVFIVTEHAGSSASLKFHVIIENNFRTLGSDPVQSLVTKCPHLYLNCRRGWLYAISTIWKGATSGILLFVTA